MSDQAADEYAGEETQDTIEASDSGASVIPGPDDAETPADAPAYPWSAEHPEWQPEDVYKSYNELRGQFSRGEHKQAPTPEPEPEEPYDPYANLPADDDERTVRQLGAMWEQKGPTQVFAWIDDPRNEGLVSEQTKGAFYAAWQQQDPLGAQRYVAEMVHNQRQAEWDQRFQQQIAPVQQHVQAQQEEAKQAMRITALSMAEQSIPDWKQWEQPVAEYISWLTTSKPKYVDALMDDVGNDPKALAGWLKSVQKMLLEQQHEARTAAGTNGAATPPPAGAATQTRSKAPSTPLTDRQKAQAHAVQRLREVEAS